MARIAVQFVAGSNMGAVSKDIAQINAQLAAMAAQISQVGNTKAGMKGFNSMMDTFRKDVGAIQGFETATMNARSITNQLTEDINKQKVALKDLGNVRRNLPQIAQEQLRLQDSRAMITGADVNGRVMGELITPTNEYAKSARLAAIETGILGRAMESAGIQTLRAGKQMQWTGRQLSAGLGAPIIAVAALSAKAAYDIDAAMVRLTKVYGGIAGVSEQELGRVEQATLDTARVVADRFGIAGKATVELAAELAAAGYEGENLQASILEIQRISLLGELDQQKAMDATRTIQTVFGISTEELAKKFNFLNAVENETNTTLQDLTEVIPRTASVVKDLGGSLEDSAIFTVAFKEAGIDAVQGANALRSSLGAIVAPSMVAQKKLMSLGIDIKKIARDNSPENGGSGLVATLSALGAELDQMGGIDRQAALSTLFGRYQFNKMNGLLKGLSENATDTSTQVGRAFSLTQASAEDLAKVAAREEKAIRESLSGRFRIAAQQIVLTFSEIGKPILAVAVKIIEVFSGVLSVLNSFPGPIKTMVATFLGILALSGPVLYITGIFKALYGQVFSLIGANKANKNGVDQLTTAQGRFAQLAATTVIPTINQETMALEKLNAAMLKTGAGVNRLAAERSARVAGGRGSRKTSAATVPNVSPAMVQAQAETDKLAQKTGVVAGHWRGIGQGIAFSLPMLLAASGSTNKWAIGLSTALLVASAFPNVFSKMGKAVAEAGIVKKMTEGGRATSILSGSVGKATGMFKALRTAVMLSLGPIALVIAAITIAVAGFNYYKKKMEEVRKETEAVNKASSSLAGVVGYEYKNATDAAAQTQDKQKESLHTLAKAWLETGEAAKTAAKAINEAGKDDRSKSADMARKISTDLAANGSTTAQALQAGRVALAAAGYSEADAREMLSEEGFRTQREAIMTQMNGLNTDLKKAMNERFSGKAAAEQNVKDFGTSIAQQLSGKTKDEIIQTIQDVAAQVNTVASEAFSDVNLDAGSKKILAGAGADTQNLESMQKFFKDTMPLMEQSGQITYSQASAFGELKTAVAEVTQEEARLVDQIKKERGLTADRYADVKTFAGLRRLEVGNLTSQAEAEAYLTQAIKDGKQETADENARRREYNATHATGKMEILGYGEAAKLAALNVARASRGLPPATKFVQGFSEAVSESAGEAKKAAKAYTEGGAGAQEFVNAMKGRMSSNANDAVSMLMDDFDRSTDTYKDVLERQDQVWEDSFDLRKQAADDSYEKQGEALDNLWDKQEKIFDKNQDKAMQTAEKTKDARIKAIEDEMEKGDKLDEQRKKMFDAEIIRIQRLSAAANRDIDFNIALKGGDLDEAARLQEAAYADSITNQMGDAGTGMDENSEKRRATGEAKIAKVTTEEDARIERLKSVQEVEREGFDKRKEMAKKSLEDAKRMSMQQFENEKQSYQRSAKAAEDSYDRARAAKRRQVESSLEQIAIEVPRTQAEYNNMFRNLDAQYSLQTGTAARKTAEWTGLHRGGFKKAMDDTLTEMGNSAAWGRMGAQSMDKMTQGMLGMSFDEYITWVETGVKPKVKTAPTNLMPKTVAGSGIRSTEFSHGGGSVGAGGSGRAGRPLDAPLYPDEVPTVLQKGEYVLDKQTVANLGVSNVKAMHAAKGQTSFYHDGGMVGAVGSGIMSTFKQAMQVAVTKQATNKAAELSAAGNYDDIPESLKFVTQAATAGKFGGSEFTDEQLKNAATIVGVGRSMGATDRDLIIGLMTAMQESTLRNINFGDRDSVGLFQQRTSQGWGSIEQIMDPKYSSKKFFEGLLGIKGRGDMNLSQAAQAVQRSAFPDAYAKWEDEARAILAGTASAGMSSGQYAGSGTFRQGGGSVTGDIQGLNSEFLSRLSKWSASVGQTYNVGSGYRSMAEQQRLYDAYRAGVPGQAPAAPPGRSNHNYGLASDGPRWGNKNPEAFGLRYPMSYEPWHVEPLNARSMRVPQLEVGGSVNYDNTLANLHKNETVLTAPLSKSLQDGINSLDSGSNVQYNINVSGAGDADAVADRVMAKIRRMEQVKGPKRVIK